MITRRTVSLLVASVIATVVMLVVLRMANKPCAVLHSSVHQPARARLLRVQDDDGGVGELPHQPSPCEQSDGITSPDHLSVIVCLILWIATLISFGHDVSEWQAAREERLVQRVGTHPTYPGMQPPGTSLEKDPGPTP